RSHAIFVRQTLEAARGEIARSGFDSAIRTLDAGLVRYPADPELQSERRGVMAQRRAAEKRASADEAIAKASALRSSGRLAEAAEPLDAFLKEHGSDTAVSELKDAIRLAQDAARRAAELHGFIRRANELLSSGKAREATEFIQKSPLHLRNA